MEPTRCTVTADVEVITVRTADGRFETTLNGGRLDGERFTCARDPDAQHERACLLARMATWPHRRRSASGKARARR
jgi:hypothetical protein